MPVPSNLINVAFIIIYPSTWYICVFFLFYIEIEGKGGWIIGGGAAKGYVGPPPLKLLGGGVAPPGPPSSYAYDIATPNSECRGSYYLSDTVLPDQAGLVNWNRRIRYKSSFQFYFTRKIQTSFGDMPVCRLG